MKTKYKIYQLVLVGTVLLLSASVTCAHPPDELELEYHLGEQTLHVSMRHTTHDAREDFIRKLVIHAGDGEPITKRYNIQANVLRFDETIHIPAEAGDLITVKAYSREGGTATDSIVVEADKDQDAKGVTKQDRAKLRHASTMKKGSGNK